MSRTVTMTDKPQSSAISQAHDYFATVICHCLGTVMALTADTVWTVDLLIICLKPSAAGKVS